MNRATLAIVAALIIIFSGIAVAITLARGYQFDVSKKTLAPTGILVATSDPDGAQVLIDGKLKTATNNTINLAPGEYKVRIQKDGFTPWEKQIEIKKEEVFKTNVFLFPSLADLRPLTFTGALNPTISSDKTKIAYGIASASAKIDGANGNGVWIMDIGRAFSAPIFSATDLRQIYANTPFLSLSDANLIWSPDDKQILAYYGDLEKPTSAYLLNTDRINDAPSQVLPTLTVILTDWTNLSLARKNAQLAKLPLNLRSLLSTSAAQLNFSPDETKILYTATASASLPHFLTAYLPGTNPTPQTRTITTNHTYVYDLKEDRNYLIPGNWSASGNQQPAGQQTSQLAWFPSSRHLLTITNNSSVSLGAGQILVMEYDGTNQAAVFNGAFNPDDVFVWPNWSKIVILTNLGSNDPLAKNLYTVNLR